MQAKLRRFAHRTDEQQDADQRDRINTIAKEPNGRPGIGWRHAEDFGNGDGAKHQKCGKDTERKAKIPHAVDDKRLDGRGIGTGLMIPKADQQVRGETHPFPTEEHLHQAVGRHEHQHRESEERQIGKEARLAGVFRHIAPAIKMDEAGDAGDDDQHDRRQRIDAQRPLDIQITRPDEVEHRHDMRFRATCHERDKDRPAERAGEEERGCRDDFRRDIANHPISKPRDDGRQQRQENDKLNGLHDA